MIRYILLQVLFLLPFALDAQLLKIDKQWVEQTLRSMTIEEKIGQLFMPVHTRMDQTSEWIARYHIGGIWFARTEAKRIAAELNQLQERSKYPLLVSVDFEKGAGTYVDGATDLPINMALGASRNPKLTFESAALTAKEARAIGVHVNFAPVLDVNNNPQNPVINTRSFGEDPKLVTRLGAEAIQGYELNGLLATGKHFPGHGNTDTDSHSHLGIVTGDRQEFDAVELFPYTEILRKGPPSNIMTAHLWIKVLDQDTIPATLSSNAIQSLLRKRMRYDGVVYTDAIVMGGITTRYPFEVATVKALQAGCDVILFPGSLEKGINAVRDAIHRGELTAKKIDESVRRILASKTRVGLHKTRSVDLTRIDKLVGTAINYSVSKRIASGCVTLAKDLKKILPLNASQRTLVLTMSNKEGNSMISMGLVSFPDEVRKLAENVQEMRLSDTLATAEVSRALELVRQADIVLVAAYVKIVLNSGTIDLPESHIRFLEAVLRENPNDVLISFGNPYICSSVPSIPTYVCAYDNARALQEATAEALFGQIPFKGKLPGTVNRTMKYGLGLTGR